MKRTLLFILCNILLLTTFAQTTFRPDILGERFEQYTYQLPKDTEGEVQATLIRLSPLTPSKQAILYLHGFNDYFFQKEAALKFDSVGIHFYALDLRKYGRSLRPHQTPFFVQNLNEYYPEIDSALHHIQQHGYEQITLMGHSTGGLIASIYLEDHPQAPVDGMVLNSPFLDINSSWLNENILIPIVSFVGKFFPMINIPQGASDAYMQSLLASEKGEWQIDTSLKLRVSPPLKAGWLRAIYQAQQRLRDGFSIDIPILVLQSDKTFTNDQWSPEFQNSDVVLDVEDIQHYTPYLGDQTQSITIKNGLHDLLLSAKEVRENVFQAMLSFIKSL